ncbi:MAG: Pr6Pr family membrane protein [Bifidobacteriaceae bacterium]|jgi:hypothetical protein|nr:Pr6Pr family membrane protein [Bifidobacteriaceae bacterium]
MVIESRIFALVFRLGAIAVIVTGLVRLVGLFGGGGGTSGGSGGAAWGAFVYYTTQSNVLCLLWLAAMAVVTIRGMARDGRRGPVEPWPRLGAMVMMAITVTMLIYLVVLAPAAFVQEGDGYRPFTLTDDLIHIITPCLTIADWFLFSPKGRLRWFDPITWAIPPYIYLLFGFTWPLFGGRFAGGQRYPYSFMDVGTLGVGGVALQIGVLTVALVAFGYIYVVADYLLARAARKRV